MFDVLTNIGKKKPQNPHFEVFGENDYPKNVLYISIVLVELGLEVMIQKEELSLRGQFLFFIIAPLSGQTVYSTLWSADGYGCEPVVDAAAYSEEYNAYRAESESQLGVEIALEGGQGRVGGDDVHRLHD